MGNECGAVQAQLAKEEQFTLGEEKQQPTREEIPHVAQPIKLTETLPPSHS